MKFKYALKKAVNIRNGYLIAIVLLLLLLVGGYFSYAIFTVSIEAKGALNIVTGNLYSLIESADLDNNKSITIEPNDSKVISIKLVNTNGRKAKVNLYYESTSNNVEVIYTNSGDRAPDKSGVILEANGSIGSFKQIYVKITNNDATSNTITFGTSAGLDTATLDFPKGKSVISSGSSTNSTSNIIKVFKMSNTSGATDFCITGEESTCEEITPTTYTPGTIVKYKVNDSEEKYFHVIKDNGDTLTMQQRENTVNNVQWYTSEDNTNGPVTLLSAIEEATNEWTNVKEQTYTLGTTNLSELTNGEYTGCSGYNSCTTNTYTLGERTAKARIMTVQEAVSLECTYSNNSCPNWMYNYLDSSISNGGTVNGTDYGYWMMSALSSNPSLAWYIGGYGNLSRNSTNSTNLGGRAVIVVDK